MSIVQNMLKEKDIPVDQYIWASGNFGFSLVASGGPKDYPTFKATSIDVHEGEGAACLKTRKTGSLGASQGMPIAAGNSDFQENLRLKG